VDREEDAEAGDGDRDWDDSEHETMPGFIRDVSNDHCEGEGRGPRGHRVELRADGGVTVGFDDAGCEEGITAVSTL